MSWTLVAQLSILMCVACAVISVVVGAFRNHDGD